MTGGLLGRALIAGVVLLLGILVAWLMARLTRVLLRRAQVDDVMAEALSEDAAHVAETLAAIHRHTIRLVFWVVMLLAGVVAFRILSLDLTSGPVRGALEPSVQQISRTLDADITYDDFRQTARGLVYTLIATLALLVFLRVQHEFFTVLRARVDAWCGSRIHALRIQRLEVLGADDVTRLIKRSIRVLGTLTTLLALYLYISAVFSFFVQTHDVASTLFAYILTPFALLAEQIVDYLPNIFFILVVVVLTHYLLRFIRFLFTAVRQGRITLRNFYPEWAEPTFQIVRFLIIAFAGVIIFPYLPGSDSLAFRAVGVFLGVLISLGSTSAVANVIAGIVLTYMRPYRIGHRVQIGAHTGDVVEKSLLVTRIRTIHNEEVIIPSATIMNSHIVNYSVGAKRHGLILRPSVTIGYATPWRTVHTLMISAAHETSHILDVPAPYVLQTALDDYFVHYQLNAFTEEPNLMHLTYSELHQHIQDKFNEAGVEIMSPHVMALRDGNHALIPPDYSPVQPPAAFRVETVDPDTSNGQPKPQRSRRRTDQA